MTEAEVRFEAVVVDIREEGRVDGRQRFQILLDRTEFVVGEQGRLEAVGRSGARLVADVLRVLRDDAGQIWHVVNKPMATDTSVVGLVQRAAQQHGVGNKLF